MYFLKGMMCGYQWIIPRGLRANLAVSTHAASEVQSAKNILRTSIISTAILMLREAVGVYISRGAAVRLKTNPVSRL